MPNSLCLSLAVGHLESRTFEDSNPAHLRIPPRCKVPLVGSLTLLGQLKASYKMTSRTWGTEISFSTERAIFGAQLLVLGTGLRPPRIPHI